ncbi:hypothetical protein AB0L06_04730 [Spirillospora sp. NPDC052269]
MSDIAFQPRPAPSRGHRAATALATAGSACHAALLGLFAPVLFFVGNFVDEPTPERLHLARLFDVAALTCGVAAVLLAGIAIAVGLRTRLGYPAALISEIVLGASGLAAMTLGPWGVALGSMSAFVSFVVCVPLFVSLRHDH